ncbi:lupus La protein [Pycnococcus provasolii]
MSAVAANSTGEEDCPPAPLVPLQGSIPPPAKGSLSSLQQSVTRQLEFYFSDSNLPRDKFLRDAVDDSSDGYVPISLVATFRRLHSFLVSRNELRRDNKALPEDSRTYKPGSEDALILELDDVPFCAKAIEQCGSSTLELSEDKRHVRRKGYTLDGEHDDAALKDVDQRSLYASPFPYTVDYGPRADGIGVVTKFFEQETGKKVSSVRLRRHMQSKDFRGSVFVEFESEEDMQAVAKMSLVFEGAELDMCSKLEYVQRKRDERAAKIAAAEAQAAAGHFREDAAVTPEKRKARDGDDADGARDAKVARTEKPKQPVSFTPGLILAFEFEGREEAPEGMQRDAIRSYFEERAKADGDAGATANGGGEQDAAEGGAEEGDGGEKEEGNEAAKEENGDDATASKKNSKGGVRFVDWKPGANSGFVRFSEPTMTSAAAASSGSLEGAVLTVRVLTGDEETAYWEQIGQGADGFDRGHRSGGRGRGGGGGRGRGGGGGRGRGGGRYGGGGRGRGGGGHRRR